MTEVKKCPKCNGDMELGYFTYAHYWKKGTGTSLLDFGRRTRVFAHKCRTCGYVELWGNEEGK